MKGAKREKPPKSEDPTPSDDGTSRVAFMSVWPMNVMAARRKRVAEAIAKAEKKK